MKIALGTIHTHHGRMTVYYNGNGEEMTAQMGDEVEEIGYCPESLKDAAETAYWMYYLPNWEYEQEENVLLDSADEVAHTLIESDRDFDPCYRMSVQDAENIIRDIRCSDTPVISFTAEELAEAYNAVADEGVAMKAISVNTDEAVWVKPYGERWIEKNGFRCEYADLSVDDKNRVDDIADELYDLPYFDGEIITTTMDTKYRTFRYCQRAKI